MLTAVFSTEDWKSEVRLNRMAGPDGADFAGRHVAQRVHWRGQSTQIIRTHGIAVTITNMTSESQSPRLFSGSF